MVEVGLQLGYVEPLVPPLIGRLPLVDPVDSQACQRHAEFYRRSFVFWMVDRGPADEPVVYIGAQ